MSALKGKPLLRKRKRPASDVTDVRGLTNFVLTFQREDAGDTGRHMGVSVIGSIRATNADHFAESSPDIAATELSEPKSMWDRIQRQLKDNGVAFGLQDEDGVSRWAWAPTTDAEPTAAAEGGNETIEKVLSRISCRFRSLTEGEQAGANHLFTVVEQGYDSLGVDENVKWFLEPSGLKAAPATCSADADRNRLLEVDPLTGKSYLYEVFASLLARFPNVRRAFHEAKESGMLLDMDTVVQGAESAFTCTAPGFYWLVSPDGEGYGGYTSCMALRMAWHELTAESSETKLYQAKQKHPFSKRDWRAFAALPLHGLCETEMIIVESVMNTCSGAVRRSPRGLNTRSWDMKFIQDKRYLPAQIVTALDAVHRHVDAGGLIPAKPTGTTSGQRHRQAWEDLIQKANLGFRMAPLTLFNYVYGLTRKHVTHPYLIARPYSPRAYKGEGPAPLGAKRVHMGPNKRK